MMSEIEKLQRKLVELQEIEQRCHKAETTLKTIEARNQLLGDSAPLGIFIINGSIMVVKQEYVQVVH